MVTYFKSSEIHFHALRSAGFITVCTYGPCAGISQHQSCYFDEGKQVEIISRATFEQARAEALAHLGLPAAWLSLPVAVEVASLATVSVEEVSPSLKQAIEHNDLPF